MNDASTIVKIRKNDDGDITNVMLQDGTVFPLDEAIRMTKDEKIHGVNVGKSKNGIEFLRADPDGDKSNNLDNLPTF
ncbi:MAG: DUF3892 domain-containing protein [Firmicutes bacterium HGW-Firmicutes-1]|jgi:hypothetical protein|nr:MAG: DUF3892 domain-containing protein [Firmicutes bacterium HGW-Firmicutes-1]